MGRSNLDCMGSRFVLFSVEGAAEGVIIQTLYDNNCLIVPHELTVMDNQYFDRPYTRLRNATKIAEEFFGMNYESDGASGLTVARIVDSKSGKFEFPKRYQNGTQVISFFTRPEIEMLMIHSEGAFNDWLRASRRNRKLKPSEFCKQELGFPHLKETPFLKDYWSSADKLIDAINVYAEHVHFDQGDFLLRDLLK